MEYVRSAMMSQEHACINISCWHDDEDDVCVSLILLELSQLFYSLNFNMHNIYVYINAFTFCSVVFLF